MISLLVRILSPFRELLVTTKVCMPLLQPSDYCAMLVVTVVHIDQSWVRLLVASLWKPVCALWYLKAGPQGGSIHFSSTQEPLRPVSDVHGVFSNMDVPSTSQEQLWAEACSIWESLG